MRKSVCRWGEAGPLLRLNPALPFSCHKTLLTFHCPSNVASLSSGEEPIPQARMQQRGDRPARSRWLMWVMRELAGAGKQADTEVRWEGKGKELSRDAFQWSCWRNRN